MPEFRSMTEPYFTPMTKPRFKSMHERPFEPMPGSTAPHSNLTAEKSDTVDPVAAGIEEIAKLLNIIAGFTPEQAKTFADSGAKFTIKFGQ